MSEMIRIPVSVGELNIAAGEAPAKGEKVRVMLPASEAARLGIAEGSRVLASKAATHWLATGTFTVTGLGQPFDRKGVAHVYAYMTADTVREMIRRTGSDKGFVAAKAVLTETGDTDDALAAYAATP
jgi:hypothetical protein